MFARAHEVHRATYLAVAVVALIASRFQADLPVGLQVGILVACVALLGVPHGALDPLLAYASGIARTPARIARFMLLYVVQASLVILTWWLAPAIALAGFLLLSVWHFRNDWSELPHWQSLSAAATLVCSPALFHPADVQVLFSMLLFGSSGAWLVPALQLIGIVALLALAFAVPGLARAEPRAALELATIPLLAWALPPLLFFVVYFCGLHSPRHIIESLRMVRLGRAAAVMSAAVITAITLVLGVAAFAFLPIAESAPRLVAIVFVGLAALTVPHMLLVERTKQRSKGTVARFGPLSRLIRR